MPIVLPSKISETDKLSSQLGKYPSFFYSIGYWPFQLGITFLFDTRGILSNWVFPQNK